MICLFICLIIQFLDKLSPNFAKKITQVNYKTMKIMKNKVDKLSPNFAKKITQVKKVVILSPKFAKKITRLHYNIMKVMNFKKLLND